MKRLILLFVAVASSAAAGTVAINGNNYTFTDHPRVFLDGPAGTITARVKDPDGAGAGVAPQATMANPAYVAMLAQVRDCRAAPTYCSNRGELSSTIALLALDWYMDNSQADSLTAAKYWINNIELAHGWYQYACETTTAYCGIGNWSDWPSLDIPQYALAYTLIRGELSAGEKTAFAQKMLNDVDVGLEDDCTNQLQKEVGAVGSVASGGTVVTGTGLAGLTAGRMIHLRVSAAAGGGWATIASVDSDSQVTLTGTPQGPNGGAFGTITNATVYERKPWDSTTCGMMWMVKNHPYSPAATIGRYVESTNSVSITTGATTFTLANAAAFPSSYPYLVATQSGELATVTNKTGNVLTVTRTNPIAQYSGKWVKYSPYLPNGSSSGDSVFNLVMTKLSGYITMGIALLDDSPTLAGNLVDQAGTTLITLSLPKQKDMWTGMNQGGSSSYGPKRQSTQTMNAVFALSTLTGAPSSDFTSGNWFKNVVYYTLYAALPGSTTWMPWGQSDVAGSAGYFDNVWAMFLPQLYPGSDEAELFNGWQRAKSLYTSDNLTTSSNERLLPYALLYQQEADGTIDYTTLPTQYVFKAVDGTVANKAIGGWFSHTGWTTGSTLVYMDGRSLGYTQDHMGLGSPAGYKLYKNGWLLTEGATNDTGQGALSNMLLFGGAANMNAVGSLVVDLDKYDSGTGWAFTRTNSLGAYTSAATATRALRYAVHFKKAASPDYLVVYDDAASSVAKSIGQNLYYKNGTGLSITSTMPDIVLTGSNRKISTKVVLPAGTGVAKTYTSTTYGHKVNLCASTDGAACASVSAAEFLVVHRPSASTSDTMPTVAALGTIDSDFVGVQIEGEAPLVAVFPKAGAYQTSTSLTSTHSGTAQYVVTGLESGIYDVVRGVTTIVDDETIDSNGTIAFESVAGAFTITRAGEVPAITVTTTTLSNAVQNQPYAAQLEYTGGTPPVAWNVSAGALCTGLSLSAAGAISGTPTLAETCNLTVRVLDDASAEDTQALSITVQTPPPTLTVSASPGSTTATIQFGTPTLDEAQSCDVVVSSAAIDPGTGNPVGPVASATSSGGPSTRTVTVSGLAASTSHTANVACGTVASGSTTFVTLEAPVGGTVNWTYTVKPHARLVARSVAKVSVEYNLVGEAADNELASCATGCTLTLPLLSGNLYEIRHIWLTAADAVVATSRKGTVAVP